MPTELETKLGQIDHELRNFSERHLGKTEELDARVLQLEQLAVSRGPGAPLGIGGEKSLESRPDRQRAVERAARLFASCRSACNAKIAAPRSASKHHYNFESF